MPHPRTDTGSSDPYWGVEEWTVSVQVPLMSETALSQNLGIPASRGNPVSYVQADGNRNMSSALAGPVPGALIGQKSSTYFPSSKKVDLPSSSH